MDQNKITGLVAKMAAGEADMAKVNAQAMTELTAEQVYTFKLAACDDQIDRDYEAFTPRTLEGLARLFVGKTVLMDHNWSVSTQTARVYDAAVEEKDGVRRLILFCYMLRLESTADIIAAIEGGILREVSVGCAVEQVKCSICGQELGTCRHVKGREYDGRTCVGMLDGARDVYEVSFVAVPAQRGAGVTKELRETVKGILAEIAGAAEPGKGAGEGPESVQEPPEGPEGSMDPGGPEKGAGGAGEGEGPEKGPAEKGHDGACPDVERERELLALEQFRF